MNNREIAIRLQGIKKQYRLGAIGGETLRADLESWWAKVRGKEDPNSIIGMDERLVGQKFWALNGIDLTVYKGERIGIIGANGAGKSTLLKLLSRITAPTEGEIDLYGRVSSMLEVGTGFHGEMTGRENIYMNGSILGMTKHEIEDMIEDIIDFSEIREFIDTPVKRYSSGMFVKLAFSVAAHLNSEIIIMDEVLAVGDMAFQHKCLDRMREAADREGRTVLYVSHNMNTIRRLCERCIVLDEGKIIFDGEAEEAISVYMDHCLGENMVDMDLTDKPRGDRIPNSGIDMVHLNVLDKAMPIFKCGEAMNLKLTVNITKPVENAMFRLTLRTESDVGLGTAFSEKISFDKIGEQDLFFSLPLDNISKGIFYVSIGFYTQNDFGFYISLDHITRLFKIEISGAPIWNTSTHGYMKFPITVKKESL